MNCEGERKVSGYSRLQVNLNEGESRPLINPGCGGQSYFQKGAGFHARKLIVHCLWDTKGREQQVVFG
jgi:hypothetical protein